MKKFLFYPIILILLIALGVCIVVYAYKSIKFDGIKIIQKEIDYKTLIPKERLLFDKLTKTSPDNRYTVFITSQNLGLKDSTIWIADKFGNLTKIDYQTGEFSFFGAVSWNKEGTKFAYLKFFPTQIVIVDVNNDFYREKILTKENNQDNNLLNPSIGYQGASYLNWNNKNQIEFEDNEAIPNKKYAYDYFTKKVTDLASNYKDDTIVNNLNNNSFFSQRDPAWRDRLLGNCSNSTIGSAGCAISSIAVAFKNLGINEINPSKLNEMLKIDGFVNDCEVKWYIAPSYSSESNIKFKGAYGNQNGFQRLDYELSQGSQVILGFDKVTYTNLPHWVLVTKKENGKYFINDPWEFKQDNQRTLDDLGSNFDHMIVYNKSANI